MFRWAMVLAIILGSCGKKSLQGERNFLVYIPEDFDNKELPVLFVLHGNPSNGWQMKTWTGMNNTADQHGFMVVYPYASNKRWPINPRENSNEISYFKDLLAHIKSEYRVDSTRFYLTGMSGGGIFSFQLMHQFPGTFAAVAVVSGNLPTEMEFAPGPTPFMYVHGTDDFLYPGREDLLSANESLERIKAANSCDGEGSEVLLPDINLKDKSTVTRIEFTCDVPVVYYRVENGGHHWPGASFDANLFYSKPLGAFNKDLNTNEAIWEFCSAFRNG